MATVLHEEWQGTLEEFPVAVDLKEGHQALDDLSYLGPPELVPLQDEDDLDERRICHGERARGRVDEAHGGLVLVGHVIEEKP
jgi:hypothetical protein